jgi:hypothetical protein
VLFDVGADILALRRESALNRRIHFFARSASRARDADTFKRASFM